MAGQVLEV